MKAHPFTVLDQHWIHVVFAASMCSSLISMILSTSIPDIILGCILSYYITDALTGVLHFGIEYYPCDDWKPTTASLLTEIHHTDVLSYSDFKTGDFLTFTYPGTVPLSLICLYLDSSSLSFSLTLFTVLFGILSPYAHCWSHERAHGVPLPWVITSLQDLNILMSAKHHNLHHFHDSERYFGFLSGNTDFITNLFLTKPDCLKEAFPLARKKYIGNMISARTSYLRGHTRHCDQA